MMLSFLAYSSVRERPDAEITPDVPPQAIQPLGLHDQEEDDEGAEHHEAEIGNQIQDGLLFEEHTAERVYGVADQDGQQGDEDGAEDRAQHRAEPTDDDHGQIVDRHPELELLVVGDAEEVRVEHAGDAGVERRDREGQQLVTEDVDPDDLGGDVLVADGDERAPHARAHEVHRADDGQHDEEEQEVVHVALAAEDQRAQPRPRDLDRRLHAAADERHVIRSEEHTSELQSQSNLVCRLLLEKKNICPTRQLHGTLIDANLMFALYLSTHAS